MGLNFTGFAQTTNNWISPVSGAWHDSTWSLGLSPRVSHSVQVTNGGSKAVMLNSTTRDAHPLSMTVHSLVLSAPSSATNTLLLNYFGTSTPLKVVDNVLVGTNGVLLNLFSGLTIGAPTGALRIHGGQAHGEGGSNRVHGLCQVGYDYSSGLCAVTNGYFQADVLELFSSNYALFRQMGGQTVFGEVAIGRWGRPGTYFLTNGLLHAGQILVGNGDFHQQNSQVFCTNGFLLQAAFGDSSVFCSIGSGSLTASSILVAGFIDSYDFSSSTFNVSGGSVHAGEIAVGDVGNIHQTGGTISAGGDIRGGIQLEAGMLMSSNTHLFNPSSFVLSARYNQNGGTNITTNRFSIGYSAMYALNAGRLDVGDLVLASGGYLQHSGGTLTNRGQTIFAGGAISLKPGHQWFGSLKLGDSSGWDTHSGLSFPPEACTAQFKNSSDVPWGPTDLLYIYDWSGSTNGGGAHRILVGPAGVTATQLEQIVFEDPAGLAPGRYNARLLSSGELVPTTTVRLAVRHSTAGLTLLWAGSFKLLNATNVAGPYQLVTNAYSPYEAPRNFPMQFFRLVEAP